MRKRIFNRTKIIATLGPASTSKVVIKELAEAGVDTFRLNFSHGSHEGHAKSIKLIREVNKELDTHIGILADLQGPKIRVGAFPEGMETFQLKEGQVVTFDTKLKACTKTKLSITYDAFAKDVHIGDRILLDDGKLEMKIVESDRVNIVKAKVIYGGLLRPKKGANLPDTQISIPSLTEKDAKDLEFILTQPVNWIALSFVRSANDIIKLKGLIEFRKHQAKVIAKIEKPEALAHMDEIIKVSDAIMVARGDLGVEIPPERVPIEQKKLVRKCIESAKPVVIATQIMESMITNPTPTRAEVTDVANAMFEGADALMVSGETAVGKYPVKVIEMFGKIMDLVEMEEEIYSSNKKPDPESDTFLSDAICYNACKIGEEVNAKGIIGMTKTGYTALLLSSYRPKSNIFIFTESKELINTFNLIWGVRAFFYDKFESTNQTIDDVHEILREQGMVSKGDVVINTGIMPLHKLGRTNMIKLSIIE